MVSAMLILDTELENRGEYPTASQPLQDWAARLWAWLRWQARPEKARSLRGRDGLAHDVSKGEEPIDAQDCGTGLIL